MKCYVCRLIVESSSENAGNNIKSVACKIIVSTKYNSETTCKPLPYAVLHHVNVFLLRFTTAVLSTVQLMLHFSLECMQTYKFAGKNVQYCQCSNFLHILRDKLQPAARSLSMILQRLPQHIGCFSRCSIDVVCATHAQLCTAVEYTRIKEKV